MIKLKRIIKFMICPIERIVITILLTNMIAMAYVLLK